MEGFLSKRGFAGIGALFEQGLLVTGIFGLLVDLAAVELLLDKVATGFTEAELLRGKGCGALLVKLLLLLLIIGLDATILVAVRGFDSDACTL